MSALNTPLVCATAICSVGEVVERFGPRRYRKVAPPGTRVPTPMAPTGALSLSEADPTARVRVSPLFLHGRDLRLHFIDPLTTIIAVSRYRP